MSLCSIDYHMNHYYMYMYIQYVGPGGSILKLVHPMTKRCGGGGGALCMKHVEMAVYFASSYAYAFSTFHCILHSSMNVHTI